MPSMFSVILTAKGSRFGAGTPLASRSSVSASIAVAAAMRACLMLLPNTASSSRAGTVTMYPPPHGVETHQILELGRVVDLDATL